MSPFLFGHRRCLFRPDNSHDECVHTVHACQNDSRNKRTEEKISDRDASHSSEQDEYKARRDELRHSPRRDDDTGGKLVIVAVSNHHRECEQAHHDHRGRNDTCCGRKQRSHENDRQSKAAAHRAEDHRDRGEQLLRQAGSLENCSHEHEKDDGEKCEIGHCAEPSVGQKFQEVRIDDTEDETEDGEYDSSASE